MSYQPSDHSQSSVDPKLHLKVLPPPNYLSQIDFRLLSVVVIVAIIFMLIGFRIITLTFGETNNSQSGKSQQRGTISDIENTPLAFSEERYNIYYSPKKAPLNKREIATISEILGDKVNTAKIDAGLENNNTFLLSRYSKKNTVDRLTQLDLPGLLIDKVNFRIYPYQSLLSQTLGFVGHDGDGLNGLELYYNDFLNYVSDLGYERNLVINVNLDLQKKIEDLIKITVTDNHADYGSIIIQEISTGRIVGLANYPNFNLNSFEKYPKQIFLNRANTYLIEPGSIFKIFFAAYLIERHNPNLEAKNYNCKGYYELSNGEIIKCHGIHGDISLQDIIKYSCNSGIIQATEKLSTDEMFAFLQRLRIEEKQGIDLPGESRGLILNPKDWGVRTKATIPLGHGLALPPIHLISIFSALIGKGFLYQPKIVRYQDQYQNGKLVQRNQIQPEIINKIISENTSRQVVDLLYYGTIKDSTGYSSRSTGFKQVFGKTATSQLANIKGGGYYTNRYHSMFAGGYPFENPQYSILVVVSQPQREYYGGKVAAPIYAQVVEALNTHYQITEERSVETLKNILNQDSPNDAYLEEFLVDEVPDFSSLSLRKAITLLENFKTIQKQKNIKVSYQLRGSGFVLEQRPPPGTRIKSDTKITLLFK